MKRKAKVVQERNWALVCVSIVLIIIGGSLVALAAMYTTVFGWWSLAIGIGGLTTIVAAVLSIVKNDPSWILLDLIIPG